MPDHKQNEAMLKEYYKTLNTDDIDAMLKFFTEDIVYEDSTLGEKFKGLKELRGFFEAFLSAMPTKFYIESLVVTEDSYGIGWRMEGKHIGDFPNMPATNKSFSCRGASIGRISGGKMSENVDYWNFSGLLVQLGLAPA